MTDPDATKRVLAIAEDTADDPALLEVILRCARDGEAEVLLIASPPRSRRRLWLPDEEARAATKTTLEAAVARLRAAGIRARGCVGDADPLDGAADDLFAADEIVLATRGRSRRPSHTLMDRIRRRFAGPIFHVLLDPAPVPEGRPLAGPAVLVPRLSERR